MNSRRGKNTWVHTLESQWKFSGIPHLRKQGALLQKEVTLLSQAHPRLSKNAELKSPPLSQQPFDTHLLSVSRLYRKSREIYVSQGGRFLATLLSSPRTLSSLGLLEPLIEYSPIERELIWAATDPLESQSTDRLMNLRSYSTSLFHEQNHRILWKFLPPSVRNKSALRRYLNFIESLVITLDMALGDELGPPLAGPFYLLGVLYDPGTTVGQELPSQRVYRNYLQATLHATYLHLELYESKDITKVITNLFPNLGPFAKRAVDRSCRLDQEFVQRTNFIWQSKHHKLLLERLCIPSSQTLKRFPPLNLPPLDLPEDPLNHYQTYLIAEKWFDLMGL